MLLKFLQTLMYTLYIVSSYHIIYIADFQINVVRIKRILYRVAHTWVYNEVRGDSTRKIKFENLTSIFKFG